MGFFRKCINISGRRPAPSYDKFLIRPWIGLVSRRIQDFPDGGCQFQRAGQPIIWTLFPENSIKKEEFWPRRGSSLTPPWDESWSLDGRTCFDGWPRFVDPPLTSSYAENKPHKGPHQEYLPHCDKITKTFTTDIKFISFHLTLAFCDFDLWMTF